MAKQARLDVNMPKWSFMNIYTNTIHFRLMLKDVPAGLRSYWLLQNLAKAYDTALFQVTIFQGSHSMGQVISFIIIF